MVNQFIVRGEHNTKGQQGQPPGGVASFTHKSIILEVQCLIFGNPDICGCSTLSNAQAQFAQFPVSEILLLSNQNI